MFEIVLGIGVCVVVAMIARADERSPVIWFCITFALCLASIFIPIPFLRFLIAGFISFVIMIVWKMRSPA